MLPICYRFVHGKTLTLIIRSNCQRPGFDYPDQTRQYGAYDVRLELRDSAFRSSRLGGGCWRRRRGSTGGLLFIAIHDLKWEKMKKPNDEKMSIKSPGNFADRFFPLIIPLKDEKFKRCCRGWIARKKCIQQAATEKVASGKSTFCLTEHEGSRGS